jgi:hypothetical protein
MWTWIIAGAVCVTDPIGYFFVSGLLMMLTPPIFYAEMAMFLATVRRYVVSKQRSGQRIMISVTVALMITLFVLSVHVAST